MTNSVESIALTEDQIIVVDKIDQFLKSPEKIFVLTGKAGTGKTTVIKYALENLIKGDTYGNALVIGITVSHKAKENLRYSIPYVNTFASTFGQREKWDDDGNQLFVADPIALRNSDCNKKWKVAVIDECSMFNKKMLKMSMTYLDKHTKIIFMGDRGQLPPIEDGTEMVYNLDSPIFELDLPDSNQHQLTKRVRQTEGNPIIDLSDIIYEEIFGNCNLHRVRKELQKTKLDDDGNGYGHINPQDMYRKFYSSTANQWLDTKMIAYRRFTIADYNKYIRGYIHGNHDEQYIPGEIIYMNKSFYCDDGMSRMLIHNSSEFIIHKIRQGEQDGVPVYLVFIAEDLALPVLQGPKGSISMEIYNHRLKEYSSKKDWQKFWGFKDLFANLSYGYALTAYKAQGSTYRNIFVDVNDIFAVKPITHKRKLQALYTAVTRASHNVYFIA